MSISAVDLSGYPPSRLSSAVEAVMRDAPEALSGRVPSVAELVSGAAATLEEGDPRAAAQFQSILEIGYLVASADGFAPAEQHALAELLSHIIGSKVTVAALELHFKDLADGCDMLGRRERLRRAAADFEDGLHRGEAIGFAALVALADGKLAEQEAATLSELGSHLGLGEDEVATAVRGVVERVQTELQRG